MGKRDNDVYRYFILKNIIGDAICIVILALISHALDKETLLFCFYRSAFTLCLGAICFIGIEVSFSMIRNRWRLKLVNEEYPLLKALVLVIIHAVVCSLTGPYGKGYYYFSVPILLCAMIIIMMEIKLWWQRL